MRKKPLLFIRLLLPFCIGIWVLRVTEFAELNFVLLISSFLLFILILIINYIYRSFKVYNHKSIFSFFLYFLLFVISGLRCSVHNELNNSDHFSKRNADYLKIFTADEPTQNGSIIKFRARVIKAIKNKRTSRVSGNLMVAIRSDGAHSLRVIYGSTFIIPARYTSVAPPYNSGEFDLRSWMANQNVYHQAFLKKEEMVSTAEQKGNFFISFSLNLRQRQMAIYRKLIKDDEAFAVATALILGYRSDLNATTLSAYSKTGTIHALSVSGMHVGIIYLVLEWMLKWMDRKGIMKWTKVLLMICMIWFYTILTGCSASVLRSAIMLTLFILTKSLHKDANSYHILILSGCILLLYQPFLLWDVGFQLSYLAVLGLIWLQPLIEGMISFKWNWIKKLWSLISLSIAAQVLTSPFSVYYFHQFPVYFIFSNLFIALPVTLLMYSGIAILLFHLHWLAPAFEWLLCFMNKGLIWMSQLPLSVIEGIWISKTEFTLLFIGLMCLLIGLQYRIKPIFWTSLLLFFILQLLLTIDYFNCNAQKKIILFSLNRNYAAAFISGRSAVLLTDLMVNNPAFKFHIQPGLDQLKVKKITCVPWEATYNSNKLIIASQQLQFYNFRVLLADSTFNRKKIMNHPVYDAVWLHLSPHLHLKTLRQQVRFRNLWIDGTNKSYALKNYLADSLNNKQRAIVLIKNNSSLINLK